MKAYKFVDWDIPELSTLADSFPAQMQEKLLRNESLTRLEKDKLFDQIYFGRGKQSIQLSGWSFDFSDWLKPYAVEYKDGSMDKLYAPDKTSLRRKLFYVRTIHELSK